MHVFSPAPSFATYFAKRASQSQVGSHYAPQSGDIVCLKTGPCEHLIGDCAHVGSLHHTKVF